MRRVRAKVESETSADGYPLSGADIRARIAQDLGTPLRDVEMMEGRLAGSDFSLNAQQGGDEGREWVETLRDDAPGAHDVVARHHDLDTARHWLTGAMLALTARERMIIMARKIEDTPETLESLGRKLGLSKERVRQLEAQALKKMRKHLEDTVGDEAEALAVAI